MPNLTRVPYELLSDRELEETRHYYDTAIAQHEASQRHWERISAGIDLIGSIRTGPREQGGHRVATQVALATLGIDPNKDFRFPERNSLAEREEAHKRKHFPWRYDG